MPRKYVTREGQPSWRKNVSKVKRYRAVQELRHDSDRYNMIKSLDFMSPGYGTMYNDAIGAIGRSTDLIELAQKLR